MPLLNSKAWKICSQGLALGALSTGTYSVKKTVNQGKEDLFFTILGESLKTENRTLRDTFRTYFSNEQNIEFLNDQDEDGWKLSSWINAGKIHEIAEEVTFDKNYIGLNLSDNYFQKIKHENMNIDYSNLLKEHCKKYLDVKVIDLFPTIGNDLIADHLSELYDIIVPWCTKPTEEYKEVKNYLKNGKTLGFLLSEKSKFDKNNSRYSGSGFLNRIFPNWSYLNYPHSLTQIAKELEWCNKELKDKNKDNNQFNKICMRPKSNNSGQIIRDLKVKKWKLRSAWVKNEKFSPLKINLE